MFVLRKINPPGKSALADEATTVALAVAALTNDIQLGDYLQSADPDARGGMGHDTWTDNPHRALQFASFEEAMMCWKAQSRVRPLRDDGRPNRPLTAYSVTVENLEKK